MLICVENNLILHVIMAIVPPKALVLGPPEEDYSTVFSRG